MLALLSLWLVLTGCEHEAKPPDPEESTIGTLNVHLSSQDRTVLPDAVSFTRFTVSFIPQNGQIPVEPQQVDRIDAPISAELEFGTWKIEAVGYKGEIPLAKGEKEFIMRQKVDSISIAVVIPIPGRYGNFRYDIAGLTNATEAQLELTGIGTNAGFSMDRVNLLETGLASDTVILQTGFYQVNVSATKGGKTITRFEAVHIYPGQNSPYTVQFPDADFSIYTLKGTISLLNNLGPPPLAAYVYVYDTTTTPPSRIGGGKITHTGDEESVAVMNGAWTIIIPDTYALNGLSFQVESINHDETASALDEVESGTITDINEIDLGSLWLGSQNIPFTIKIGESAPMPAAAAAKSAEYYYQIPRGEPVLVTLNNAADTPLCWLIDGKLVDEGVREILINTDDYEVGKHTLVVEVQWHDTDQTRMFNFEIEE